MAKKNKETIEAIKTPIKKKKEISAMTACDVLAVNSRMRFVVERKYLIKDKYTLNEWRSLFESENIID